METSLEQHEDAIAALAAVNAVTSAALVENIGDTNALARFQNQLDDSRDRVGAVKETLTALKAHELTPRLAQALDKSLELAEVPIPPAVAEGEVMGAEALGITLMPKDYIMSRLMGCENFIGDMFQKTKEVTSLVSKNFQDSWILFTQSQDSLEQALDILEDSLKEIPKYESNLKPVALGVRLFNLFKVNGQVSEKWAEELTKVSKTLTALNSNYLLNSQRTLNNAMSFFGGFEDLETLEAAEQRFCQLPKAIPSVPFKECVYPAKHYMPTVERDVVAKVSVELMGGAVFLDKRYTGGTKNELTSMDQVSDYLNRHLQIDGTVFIKEGETIYPKLGDEVKSLTHSQVAAMVKLMKQIIADYRKVFEANNKYALVDGEVAEIGKGIAESKLPDNVKDTLITAFASILRENQLELLNIRGNINTYLVLLVNGMIELCHSSLRVNTLEDE